MRRARLPARFGSFATPSERDLWDRALALPLAPLGLRALPPVGVTMRVDDALPDWWLHDEVDEIRVELPTPLSRDRVRGVSCTARVAVPPAVRNGVERVRDRDDACGERDLQSAQPTRIAGAIPSFVMRQDTVGQLGIEAAQR